MEKKQPCFLCDECCRAMGEASLHSPEVDDDSPDDRGTAFAEGTSVCSLSDWPSGKSDNEANQSRFLQVDHV